MKPSTIVFLFNSMITTVLGHYEEPSRVSPLEQVPSPTVTKPTFSTIAGEGQISHIVHSVRFIPKNLNFVHTQLEDAMHTSKDDTIPLITINGTNHSLYTRTENLHALRVPFGKGEGYMALFLPNVTAAIFCKDVPASLYEDSLNFTIWLGVNISNSSLEIPIREDRAVDFCQSFSVHEHLGNYSTTMSITSTSTLTPRLSSTSSNFFKPSITSGQSSSSGSSSLSQSAMPTTSHATTIKATSATCAAQTSTKSAVQTGGTTIAPTLSRSKKETTVSVLSTSTLPFITTTEGPTSVMILSTSTALSLIIFSTSTAPSLRIDMVALATPGSFNDVISSADRAPDKRATTTYTIPRESMRISVDNIEFQSPSSERTKLDEETTLSRTSRKPTKARSQLSMTEPFSRTSISKTSSHNPGTEAGDQQRTSTASDKYSRTITTTRVPTRISNSSCTKTSRPSPASTHHKHGQDSDARLPTRSVLPSLTSTYANIPTWHTSCSVIVHVLSAPANPIAETVNYYKTPSQPSDKATPQSNFSNDLGSGHETSTGHRHPSHTETGRPMKSGANAAREKLHDPMTAHIVLLLWVLVGLEVLVRFMSFQENVWGELRIFGFRL